MNITSTAILVSALLAVTGCASVNVPAPPKQGPISEESGGLAGYQHGAENTKFLLGANARWSAQSGYLKDTGEIGTVAIRESNGSVFGVPNAHAVSVNKAPYGRSPQDHDTYVRGYFVALGLPVDQIESVQAMTLLEADGRSDESVRSVPRVTAYFSVMSRGASDVKVADSFAWARANVDGSIVQEGVYWPALPPRVLTEVAQFKEMLANAESRRAFESRLPIASASGTLVIHHSSATEDQFEAFASLDISSRSILAVGLADNAAGPNTKAARGMVVTRHFDINGSERYLPHETTQLADKYPQAKVPSQ